MKASYGVDGSKDKGLCSQHAKQGMVHVAKKRCGHPLRTTGPSYGIEGSKKPEFCTHHAQQGMNIVVKRRCGHPRCALIASFGTAGDKVAFFSQGSVEFESVPYGYVRCCFCCVWVAVVLEYAQGSTRTRC